MEILIKAWLFFQVLWPVFLVAGVSIALAWWRSRNGLPPVEMPFDGPPQQQPPIIGGS